MKCKSDVINVSADDLWKIVGTGFTDISNWSTGVDVSLGIGKAEIDGAARGGRFCELNAKGFDKISEKLTVFSNEKKEFAYDVVDGTPGFVLYINNYWQVASAGENQSTLEMTITMHLKTLMGFLMGGVFKKNLTKALESAVRDLKIYAETGEVSEQKRRRIEKVKQQHQ